MCKDNIKSSSECTENVNHECCGTCHRLREEETDEDNKPQDGKNYDDYNTDQADKGYYPIDGFKVNLFPLPLSKP